MCFLLPLMLHINMCSIDLIKSKILDFGIEKVKFPWFFQYKLREKNLKKWFVSVIVIMAYRVKHVVMYFD